MKAPAPARSHDVALLASDRRFNGAGHSIRGSGTAFGVRRLKLVRCRPTCRQRAVFGGSHLARTPFIAALVLYLVPFYIAPIGHLRAQVPATAGHNHLTEVACVDVPPGEKRPEFGCFNIATVTGLHFSQASVYWRLRAFPAGRPRRRPRVRPDLWWRKTGECGCPNSVPETLPRGEARLSPSSDHCSFPQQRATPRCSRYAVMRPGDNSRVHTHPGPEGWKVLAGEQCLETPAGATRGRAGGTMTVEGNTPMELNITGTTIRRAFALVIHDSAQREASPLTGNRRGPVVSSDCRDRLSEVRLTKVTGE